jgi:hypothetical protein
MLPPACTGMPLAARMCPSRVVVVFPLEPVVPMIRLRNQLAAPGHRSPERRAAGGSAIQSAALRGEHDQVRREGNRLLRLDDRA